MQEGLISILEIEGVNDKQKKSKERTERGKSRKNVECFSAKCQGVRAKYEFYEAFSRQFGQSVPTRGCFLEMGKRFLVPW